MPEYTPTEPTDNLNEDVSTHSFGDNQEDDYEKRLHEIDDSEYTKQFYSACHGRDLAYLETVDFTLIPKGVHANMYRQLTRGNRSRYDPIEQKYVPADWDNETPDEKIVREQIIELLKVNKHNLSNELTRENKMLVACVEHCTSKITSHTNHILRQKGIDPHDKEQVDNYLSQRGLDKERREQLTQQMEQVITSSCTIM